MILVILKRYLDKNNRWGRLYKTRQHYWNWKTIQVNVLSWKNKSDQILKILRSNVEIGWNELLQEKWPSDVILVKPEYKNDFGGIIHDEKCFKAILFMLNQENVEINNEIGILSVKKEKKYQNF